MSNTPPTLHRPCRNRYLLMRHGHSEANAAGCIISRPERGLSGFGLSPLGHAQLKDLLAAWPWPPPDRLVHSDFRRTAETADWIAQHFGLPLSADIRLRERSFGELDGLSDCRYPDIWTLDADDPGHQLFGVESVIGVAERMLAVVAALEAATHGETILLVSHGDPLQILLTAVEERPLSTHRNREPLLPGGIVALP